jgi:hypothetical protein
MHVWLAWIAIMISFLVGACAEHRGPALGPEGAESGALVEAAWVADREAVTRAAAVARRHPLVLSLDRELDVAGLTPDESGAALLRGRMADGGRAVVTILPRIRGDDSTRALYVALSESGDRAVASSWEMIAGRDPRADEPGFDGVMWADRLVWIRTGAEVVNAAVAGGQGAGQRWNRQKFMACVNAEMPAVRNIGAPLELPGGSRIVRNVVESIAGAAVVISCAFKALW